MSGFDNTWQSTGRFVRAMNRAKAYDRTIERKHRIAPARLHQPGGKSRGSSRPRHQRERAAGASIIRASYSLARGHRNRYQAAVPSSQPRSRPRTAGPVSTPDLPFELRRSPIQGIGAFATRRIRKGQRVIEYRGERISSEEADRRYDQSRMRRHHTFLFTLDDETVVDGARQGNEAIYINHSCEPNCQAFTVGRHIWIYAKRTIQPGEELTFDYKYQRTGDPEEDAELERFYRCKCGAARCRGSILVAPKKRAARHKT
jgi:hypothetical protein